VHTRTEEKKSYQGEVVLEILILANIPRRNSPENHYHWQTILGEIVLKILFTVLAYIHTEER